MSHSYYMYHKSFSPRAGVRYTRVVAMAVPLVAIERIVAFCGMTIAFFSLALSSFT